MSNNVSPPLITPHHNLRTLTWAILVTVCVGLTYQYYAATDFWAKTLPVSVLRYIDNSLCLLIISVFLVLLFYAVFQMVGLWVDRLHFQILAQDVDNPEKVHCAYNFACYVSGRCLFKQDPLMQQIDAWLNHPTQDTQNKAYFIDNTLLVRHYLQRDSIAVLHFGIWALPLLGFIGTVLGISQAVTGLKPLIGKAAVEQGENLGDSMQTVIAGLHTAFDTTFLALCLVIVCMLLLELLKRQWLMLDLQYKSLFLQRENLNR